MAISEIGHFFRAIGQDLEIILNNPADKSESRNERIASVSLRILGGIFAVAATTRFITTLITYAADPFSPVWIISAVFTAIVAYDLLKIASNIERNVERREMGALTALGKAVANPSFFIEEQKDLQFEKDNGIPFAFRDTLIVQHVGKWAKSHNL